MTDRTTLAADLADACRDAKRAQHLIERAGDESTPWTAAHREINRLLDDLERAPSIAPPSDTHHAEGTR